jgi:hypothetical protein
VLAWNGKGASRRRRIAEGFSPEAINGPIYEDFKRLSGRPKNVMGRSMGASPVRHMASTGSGGRG